MHIKVFQSSVIQNLQFLGIVRYTTKILDFFFSKSKLFLNIYCFSRVLRNMIRKYIYIHIGCLFIFIKQPSVSHFSCSVSDYSALPAPHPGLKCSVLKAVIWNNIFEYITYIIVTNLENEKWHIISPCACQEMKLKRY